MQDSGHLEKKEKQMKKFIGPLVIASLIGGAAFAQSTNVVSSANVVGYNQITIPSNQYVMVSLDFERGASNTVTALFGTLPNGSKVSVWDTVNQRYVTYLRGLTGFGTSGTNRITIGSGCFVSLPANVQTNIYLSGDVPTAKTTAVYKVNGYAILSYPYPVDVAITNMTLGKTAVNGNKISVWNGSGYTTYLRGLTGWGTAGSNVLKVGQAFFFQGTVNTNVNETIPYTLE